MFVSMIQIMVRDLHYIQGSKTLPKVLPPLEQKESVLKHSGKRLIVLTMFLPIMGLAI